VAQRFNTVLHVGLSLRQCLRHDGCALIANGVAPTTETKAPHLLELSWMVDGSQPQRQIEQHGSGPCRAGMMPKISDFFKGFDRLFRLFGYKRWSDPSPNALRVFRCLGVSTKHWSSRQITCTDTEDPLVGSLSKLARPLHQLCPAGGVNSSHLSGGAP
jgi:hypothetical protein